MKNACAFLCALTLTAGSGALAQTRYGTVFLNNYDSGKGLFDVTCGIPARVGTSIEVLGGVSGSSLVVISSTSLGNPARYTIQEADLDVLGPGTGSFFEYGFGEVWGVFPGATATFRLRFWRRASRYDQASAIGSISWTQPIGTNPEPPELPHPAVLQIPYPPRLSLPGLSWVVVSPPSQAVPAGATVTFSVNLGFLHYQWSRDGLTLAGATNATVSLTNVTRADAGVYDAAVTNACGDAFYHVPGSLRVLVPQRFDTPTQLSDGRVRLPFRDHDGNVAKLSYATSYFAVQASTNLLDWQTASGSLALTNGFLVFEESSPLNSRERFYRILER